MTLYSYETSKIIIHNIHHEKEIEIVFEAYLLLCKHLKKFLHLVPRAYCRDSQGY